MPTESFALQKVKRLSLRDDQVILLNGIPFDAYALDGLRAIFEMDTLHSLRFDLWGGLFNILLVEMNKDNKRESFDFNQNFIVVINLYYEMLHRFEPIILLMESGFPDSDAR